MPEGAFGIPLKSCPITLGISVAPEMAANSDWFYNDTPGGLGGTTTYGPQQHRSQIIVLRTAIGAGWKLSDKWSVGASFGTIYNDNILHAPYIFQTEPTLAGAKTLLDLRTDGFGFNGQVGAMFRPRENVQLGLTYKSATVVRTEGTAAGDAGAQFAVPSVPFRYNAFVKNRFPHVVTGGASWQVDDKWRLAFQMDWIGWKDAFKTLPVRLQNGSSVAVNTIVGSTSLNDNVPLNWRDQVIVRAGVEYALTEALKLRGGYAYGNSPVPDTTLTPLTAVISEHTFSAGLGYAWRKCQFDFAYQLEIPASRSVGTSGLLSGEYSNSRTDVTIHTLAFTTSIRF
jgi:long-chain fatty acid transport protein